MTVFILSYYANLFVAGDRWMDPPYLQLSLAHQIAYVGKYAPKATVYGTVISKLQYLEKNTSKVIGENTKH